MVSTMISKVKLTFEVGSKSVPGTRHDYQDRILVDKERLLFAVADGVTSSYPTGSMGEIAAELSLKILQINSASDADLAKVIANLNTIICEMRDRNPRIGETTITAGKIDGDWIRLVNVGDSPAHILRGERLRRLYTPDVGPFGGLSQGIGYRDERKGFIVHQRSARILPEDLIIIASDGITKTIRTSIWNPEHPGNTARPILTAKEIRAIVASSSSLDDAAASIFELAQIKRPDIDDDKSIILIKANLRG